VCSWFSTAATARRIPWSLSFLPPVVVPSLLPVVSGLPPSLVWGSPPFPGTRFPVLFFASPCWFSPPTSRGSLLRPCNLPLALFCPPAAAASHCARASPFSTDFSPGSSECAGLCVDQRSSPASPGLLRAPYEAWWLASDVRLFRFLATAGHRILAPLHPLLLRVARRFGSPFLARSGPRASVRVRAGRRLCGPPGRAPFGPRPRPAAARWRPFPSTLLVFLAVATPARPSSARPRPCALRRPRAPRPLCHALRRAAARLPPSSPCLPPRAPVLPRDVTRAPTCLPHPAAAGVPPLGVPRWRLRFAAHLLGHGPAMPAHYSRAAGRHTALTATRCAFGTHLLWPPLALGAVVLAGACPFGLRGRGSLGCALGARYARSGVRPRGAGRAVPVSAPGAAFDPFLRAVSSRPLCSWFVTASSDLPSPAPRALFAGPLLRSLPAAAGPCGHPRALRRCGCTRGDCFMCPVRACLAPLVTGPGRPAAHPSAAVCSTGPRPQPGTHPLFMRLHGRAALAIASSAGSARLLPWPPSSFLPRRGCCLSAKLCPRQPALRFSGPAGHPLAPALVWRRLWRLARSARPVHLPAPLGPRLAAAAGLFSVLAHDTWASHGTRVPATLTTASGCGAITAAVFCRGGLQRRVALFLIGAGLLLWALPPPLSSPGPGPHLCRPADSCRPSAANPLCLPCLGHRAAFSPPVELP